MFFENLTTIFLKQIDSTKRSRIGKAFIQTRNPNLSNIVEQRGWGGCDRTRQTTGVMKIFCSYIDMRQSRGHRLCKIVRYYGLIVEFVGEEPAQEECRWGSCRLWRITEGSTGDDDEVLIGLGGFFWVESQHIRILILKFLKTFWKFEFVLDLFFNFF